MKHLTAILILLVILALLIAIETLKAEDLTTVLQDTASKEEYLAIQEEVTMSSEKVAELKSQLQLEEAKKAYNTSKIKQLKVRNELREVEAQRDTLAQQLSVANKNVTESYNKLKLIQGK